MELCIYIGDRIMRTMHQELLESGKALGKSADELNEITARLWLLESQLDQIKALILNMDKVQNLPNQALREAEVNMILDTHEEYSPIYRNTLQTRAESRIAHTNWQLALELNKNVRALLMNGGLSE